MEEAVLTEQLGETEPGKSALSFHRTGGETLDEAPLQNTKITVTGMDATMEAAIM